MPKPPSGSAVEGQAHGVQITTGTNWFTRDQETTLSFVVERFDDEGNRLFVAPVELRGSNIEGFVREGHWVQVAGTYRSGTLRARRIVNVDTGAVVTGGGMPAVAKVVGIALLIGIAVFVLFGFALAFAGEA